MTAISYQSFMLLHVLWQLLFKLCVDFLCSYWRQFALPSASAYGL